MPRSMHLHTEIYRIWKVYLNYSKCTWKVSILLYKHHAIIESRATRHSAVSAFTETVEFLKRSLASMLMRYCCSMIGCCFFSRHNRFAETHSHLQLSYHTSNSFPKSLPDLTNLFQLKELIIWIYIIWHVILPIRKDAVRWYRYSLP